MMYGLGDNPRPLQSTAALVEKIVLQQLILLIGKAEEVADKRRADGIYPQDILFLMRNNIIILNRIITHICKSNICFIFSVTCRKNHTVKLNHSTCDSLTRSVV